ncbi:hypothetical protein [Paenibacillus silvae]|uniref:hypothetical protein n=2 Tax=Paenibacillus silvae TaxID=1325358 RepID=UPI0020037576|nr:hypothetical protein [Paenibacillus silvae]
MMTTDRVRSKERNRSPILKIAIVLALLTPAVLVLPEVHSATASPVNNEMSGAKTAPPPLDSRDHSIQSRAANPVHIYQAESTLTRGEGLQAIIKTTTMTYKNMKTLSAQYRLERWTGTAWVTYKASSSSQTQTSVLYAGSDWDVLAGYYYRVVSTHTAYDGKVTDQVTRTSNSILF